MADDHAIPVADLLDAFGSGAGPWRNHLDDMAAQGLMDLGAIERSAQANFCRIYDVAMPKAKLAQHFAAWAEGPELSTLIAGAMKVLSAIYAVACVAPASDPPPPIAGSPNHKERTS